MLSALINFILVAAVVYFLIVMPYNRLRKKGEVEQAQDTELAVLTEIRDLLADQNGAVKQVDRPRHRAQPRHRQVHERRQRLTAHKIGPRREPGADLLTCRECQFMFQGSP